MNKCMSAMENVSSGSTVPPKNSPPGSLWYNVVNDNFYYKDEHDRWIATDLEDWIVTDLEDQVIDIIEEDSAEQAYDRAMGVLSWILKLY